MATRRNHAKEDAVQGAVELGPRSLALLRRILTCLEILANNGNQVPDPGKNEEIDAEEV